MSKPPRYRHSPFGTVWKILRGRLGLRCPPLFVNLLLTYRCNLRCDYCEVWQEPRDELDTPELLALIDGIADAGTERLSLSGGEPMIRRDIGTLIGHAKKRSLTVNLVSNGLHIPERIEELRGLDYLAISLDGPPAIHDQQRGKGAFDMALAAIRAARSAGIEVWTTTVLTAVNLDQIESIQTFARREGVRTTYLPVMHEGLRANHTGVETLLPSPAQWKQAMDQLLTESRRRDTALALSPRLLRFYRDHWGNPAGRRRAGAWHAGRLRCQAGRMFASIAPSGNLHPCNFLQVSGTGIDAIDRGFAKAWQGLEAPNCEGCWCDSFIDANLVFGFDPSAIWHTWRLLRRPSPSPDTAMAANLPAEWPQ